MKTVMLHNNPPSEEMLLEMIRRNDPSAFEILYKKYWDPLSRYASKYFPDRFTCEELIQELFIHIHSRRLSLNVTSSLSAYLYRALRNKMLNYIRNQAIYKKHIGIAAGMISTVQNNVYSFVSVKELQQGISSSVKAMNAKCKEVYILHQQQDFTARKIANVLNRPVDTVEKQLRRAKKKVQEYVRTHCKEV